MGHVPIFPCKLCQSYISTVHFMATRHAWKWGIHQHSKKKNLAYLAYKQLFFFFFSHASTRLRETHPHCAMYMVFISSMLIRTKLTLTNKCMAFNSWAATITSMIQRSTRIARNFYSTLILLNLSCWRRSSEAWIAPAYVSLWIEKFWAPHPWRPQHYPWRPELHSPLAIGPQNIIFGGQKMLQLIIFDDQSCIHL